MLSLHSLVRWLVLVFLFFAIFRACRGKVRKQPFSRFDNTIRMMTLIIVQIQFCIGMVLYFQSPVVNYFLHNFKEAVHIRDLRFFGMEHITMMVLAVAVISIGSDRVRKLSNHEQKYKTMAIWFAVGLLLILISIPWSFSPFTCRPNIRPF